MHIIDFLSGKGGTGKTTLALQVAGCLSEQGARVAVVDLDPQQSALSWAAAARKAGVELPFAVVATQTEAKHYRADVALIDHPPIVDPEPRGKVAVLPVRPSILDVQAARRAGKALPSEIRVLDVLNGLSSTRRDDRMLLEDMQPAAFVRDRSIYRRSIGEFRTVFSPDIATWYGVREARDEIETLCSAIVGVLS